MDNNRPAGLAAAVSGASEGLATVLLDSAGLGGQAAKSSRIENYLGFPQGVSSENLIRPGVFAVGDVRSGSTKRVATAVGEGASAVSSVHRTLDAH